MEGGIDANSVLDVAVFHTMVNHNRFDATICSKGKFEKIASGCLDILALHLPKAKDAHSKHRTDSFKLELVEMTKSCPWFTKSTVSSFLCLVNSSELLRSVNSIQNEISQLEDTRKCHLALYAEDLLNHPSGVLGDGWNLMEVGFTPKVRVETASADATKNELLWAIERRLRALRQTLSATLNQALGTAASTKLISDVAAFCQYFGAKDMGNSLLQYLELNSTERFSNVSDQQSALSRDVLSNSGKTTDETSQAASPSFTVKSVKPGLSPGDVVQAEQQNPSESDASSESCDEHLSPIERSHPLKRSGSQRRSASPMRRIQIGRSGSRRSAAIAIKSLNYFATRERTVHNVDTEGKNSDDDESDRSSENHKTSVNKMSVQNAISIFESKQKDQSLNFYKNGSDVATSIANKSVLRRWSAGMCDYRNQDTRRNTSKSELRRESDNLLPAAEGENISEMKSEPNIAIFYQNKVEDPAIERSLMEDIMTSASTNDHVHLDAPANNRFRMGGAGEWTQQKEADINQILLKMTENKPSESHRSALESGGNKETCGEKRGDFYSQYKEKRDEKLRSETARQRAEKELQFKMMQEALDQRKAEMHSNALAAPGKLDSSSHPQKSRRNSCPPVLPRKEPSKSAVSKKPAPKSSSPKPITHSSSPSTPSSRTMGVASARSSSRTLSSNTPTLRKPQPALPSTNSGPDTEKSLLRPSGSSGSQAQGKIAAKSKENKKQSSLSSRRISRTKVSAQGNDSNEVLAKADLRSKVTKKSSVVPLEAKPFLKKGGLRSVAPATLPPQSDGSLRTGGNPAQEEKKDPVVGMADSIPQPSDEASTRTTPGNGENSENVSNYDVNQETTEDLAPVPGAGLPSEKNQPDEDLGVSSGPWEEPGIAHQGPSEACGSSMARAAASSAITPVPSPGPLLHHPPSLISEASHTEKEITEWGNAEKPPALVYHKDPPKGLRRLFMFGRSTPSLFSKGRGDAQEEGKSASKRSGDAQEEGFGPQKTALSEIHDGGPSSRASMDACAASDFPPAQSSTSSLPLQSPSKPREGNLSSAVVSTKAARSFFSLSTFRSSRSSETKLRLCGNH